MILDAEQVADIRRFMTSQPQGFQALSRAETLDLCDTIDALRAAPAGITLADWSDLVSAVSNMETLAAQLEERPDLVGSAYPGAVRRRANTMESLAAKIKAILPPTTE